jgi:hypothetical protein
LTWARWRLLSTFRFDFCQQGGSPHASTAPCGTVPLLDQLDDDVVRDPLAEVVSSEVKVVAR